MMSPSRVRELVQRGITSRELWASADYWRRQAAVTAARGYTDAALSASARAESEAEAAEAVASMESGK